MSFTIGSLFDGSGGFPLAAFMCGGTPVWASEVEPYPIAVTKTRFPYMKHLGSVTDIKGNEVEPVDVITFGSPCQDLSVAGKRAGLKHTDNGDEETTRSGLFMEAVRIIKEMREATNGEYPRFAVWENVPGAFSSNKGEDFRIVLEELIKIVEPTAVMPAVPKNGWPYADSYIGDGWSLAYRVLDSQFWGVPQRRRRIYLVLDLGGECAGKVSFEREGLRGYFTEGRTPWQGIAGDVADRTGTADCEGAVGLDIYNLAITGKCAASLTTATGQGASNTGPSVCVPVTLEPVIAIDQQGGKGGANYAENVMPTLCSDSHGTPHAVAYSLHPMSSNSMKSSNPHSGFHQTNVARTIDTTNPDPSKNQGGIAIVQPLRMATQQGGAEIMEGKCPTITAAAGMSGNNQPVVCYSDMCWDDQGGQQISVRDDGKSPTLRAETHGNLPCVMGVYKADDGSTGNASPTLVGDHNNRVTDHSALVVCCQPCVSLASGKEVTGCLMASGYEKLGAQEMFSGDYNHNSNNVVRIQYIVRRLTPTECARLQGFPDRWATPDEKSEFSDEEYAFWLNVRNTHAEINGKATKEYTKDQMLNWYNKLHTDSAAYKLWGNGIALPTALYVMQGIAEVLK